MPSESNQPQNETARIIYLPEIPSRPPKSTGTWLASLAPAAATLCYLGFSAFSLRSFPSLVLGGVMCTLMLALSGFNIHRSVKTYEHTLIETRDAFYTNLESTRAQIRALAETQRSAAQTNPLSPKPLALNPAGIREVPPPESASPPRIYLGLGSVALAASFSPAAHNPNPDYPCTLALERLLGVQSRLEDMPVDISLAHFPKFVAPNSRPVRDWMHYLILQLCALLPPARLRIYLPSGKTWNALTVLPHVEWETTETRPSIAPSEQANKSFLAAQDDEKLPLPTPPHATARRLSALEPTLYHLRVESVAPSPACFLRVSLTTSAPSPATAGEKREEGELTVLGTRFKLTWPDKQRIEEFTPYTLSKPVAYALARTLTAPVASHVTAKEKDLDFWRAHALTPTRLTELETHWSAVNSGLKATLGIDSAGQTVHIDLAESAKGGIGPHGIVIGATGSGKSELLRTLMLSLMLRYSPEQLNFVLADFKGGATFAPLEHAPHVSALVTNLEQQAHLISRFALSLRGEMHRRQQLLYEQGNYANVEQYEAARRNSKHAGPALPELLIIVDEFSELLNAHPDFTEVFGQIGRLGRSLGLHLLLASQRFEEGRLRGLESHLSYRLVLRTFGALESRLLLGDESAYNFPPEPGYAIVSHGGEKTKIKAFYVSDPDPKSPLTQITNRLQEHPRSAHPLWLPQLRTPVPLTTALGPLRPQRGRGLSAPHSRLNQLDLAQQDLPELGRQEHYYFDACAGHVRIVGKPGSGKSSFLRLLLTLISLSTTTEQAEAYLFDYAGISLSPYARLPHVAALTSPDKPQFTHTIFTKLLRVLTEREKTLREGQQKTNQTEEDEHNPPSDPLKRIFVLIDGWSELYGSDPYAEECLTILAQRGSGCGIHLIATSPRHLDFRAQVKDQFHTVFELALGDESETIHGREKARSLPRDVPGRALGPHGESLLFHSPALADESAAGLPSVQTLAKAYFECQATPPYKLRELPQLISREELEGETTGTEVIVGVSAPDQEPLHWDYHQVPHLLVSGINGKTSFLRLLATQLEKAENALIVVDPHAQLRENSSLLFPPLQTAALAKARFAELRDYFDRRLANASERSYAQTTTSSPPKNAVAPASKRVFVLVDDYEHLNAAGDYPLAALQAILPVAKAAGLHVVLCLRKLEDSLGDPLLSTLQKIGAGYVHFGGAGAPTGTRGYASAPHPSPAGRAWVSWRDETQLVQILWQAPGSVSEENRKHLAKKACASEENQGSSP